MLRVFLINEEKDNVVTAVSDIKAGEVIPVKKGSVSKEVKAKEAIAFGHKMALSNLAKGADIIKYGGVIGSAKKDIAAGEWVHTHNTEDTYAPIR